MKSNQELAVETGVKFDYYAVALTFTILAFGAQTGEFTGHAIPDFLEAASWILLLISGLSGLSRLEYLPVLYRAQHHLQTAPVVDANIEGAVPVLEKTHRYKYRIQRWTFVVGISLLVFARIISRIQVASA